MSDKKKTGTARRGFLRSTALAGTAGAAAAATIAAPWVRRAGAADTTTWKVQTSWPAGVGLETFQAWCGTIKEKTGGELEFKPFKAKDIVGDFELLDGVKNGVLEAMNSFTLYWAGKLPATAFLSSYTMGLRYPHEWDIFFYSKGGLQAARDIFAKQGLYYVDRIHHGPNIIHSKTPIRSIEDFKGLKLRVPGGMIAERLRQGRRQDDPAARRRGVLGAGEGHHRRGRLYRSGGQLGARLPAGDQVHLDGPARPGVDLPAGRPDGFLRQHGCLEQALADR